MFKQIQQTIYILFLLWVGVGYAQFSTSVYNFGDIPTGFETSSQCNPLRELQVSIPPGSIVASVDVEYQMTASNLGWMSDQRSRITYVEDGVSEVTYSSGIGDTPGTYSYNRTGLIIANGTSLTGVLTFQMEAYSVIWEGTAGCSTDENKVDNNSWIITVNYTAPPPVAEGYLGPGGVGSIDGTSSLVLWTNPDDISEK